MNPSPSVFRAIAGVLSALLLLVACSNEAGTASDSPTGGAAGAGVTAGQAGTPAATAGAGSGSTGGASNTGGASVAAGTSGSSAGSAGAQPINLNPPSVPKGLKVGDNDGCSMATLTWEVASANPAGAALRGYQVYVNGVHRFTTLTNKQTLTLSAYNFAAGISYSLSVAALAEDGSVSAQSQGLSYTPVVCGHGPASPTQPQATVVGCREVRITWQAATQAGPNDAVYGYLVYRDGLPVGDGSRVLGTAASDFGLTAGVPHTYAIQTVSDQALVSPLVQVQVTTPRCTDTAPPSQPANLTGAALSNTCLYLGLKWSAATDDVGVHHYNLYRDGRFFQAVSPKAQPSATSDLVVQVTYRYTVAAVDAAGNESAQSNDFSFTPDCSAAVGMSRHLAAAVVLANFPDVLQQPFTVADANARVFGATNSLASYLKDASYGSLDISGSVFGWYTLPKSIGSYCTGPTHNTCSGLDAAAMASAKTDIGSFSFDRSIDVFSGIGAAGEGGGTALTIADWAFDVGSLGHELGHTLFLGHAGDLECTAGEVTAPNLLNLSEGGCKAGRYTDPYDIMGAGNTGQYSTYRKEIIGALGTSQVAIAKESGTFTLEVMETKGNGIKELRIPLEVNGFFYFLEYRKPIGMDAAKPVDGVLIRLRETSTLTDADTLLLHGVINPDQPFYDRYRNIRVEALDKTDTQITLKVSR